VNGPTQSAYLPPEGNLSLTGKFSRKTWLIIIGLIIIALALPVAIALVKQKQLPWTRGLYEPPSGLSPHPIAKAETPFVIVAYPKCPPNPYLQLEAKPCCVRVRYNYDPYINIWFKQEGNWVKIVEKMILGPGQWYEICLTDYKDQGYDPTESAEVAIITLQGRCACTRYRNDIVVPPCEKETTPTPTPTPSSTPSGEPSPTPTPTPSPTPTPTESPTPTPSGEPSPTPTPSPPPAKCGESCTYNSDCEGDLVCRDVEGTIRCVNKDCPFDEDCICEAERTSPPAGAPTAPSTPTPAPPRVEQPEELPPAANITRTGLGIITGIILILLGLSL
jgi:hypothetical protein